MRYRAIAYDVGTFFRRDKSSRPSFEETLAKHELAIIKNDLHCNAVRIFGQDIDRLMTAATLALEQGLTVWLSPMLVDATAEQTLLYLTECARRAESLRAAHDNILFVVGGECSFYMKGIIDGEDLYARIKKFISVRGQLWHLLSGGRWPGRRLNAYLKSAAAAVREHFKGQITYAAGTWERVDWRLFDLVGGNYYRDAHNAKSYRRGLQQYFRFGKPVLITEFGCCTYEGADAKGAAGWGIVDASGPRPKIKGGHIRSEETQARYLDELLTLFAAEPLEGVCVFGFAVCTMLHDSDPQWDLDMASYGVVKMLAKDRDPIGSAAVPWEPKAAFRVVADHYRRIDNP